MGILLLRSESSGDLYTILFALPSSGWQNIMKQQQEQQMTIRKGGTQIIQVHQYSLQIPVQGPAERPEGALTCNEKGIKRMYGMVYDYVVWYLYLLAAQTGKGGRWQSRLWPYFSQRLQKCLNISSQTHRPDCRGAFLHAAAFLQFSPQKAASHKLAKSEAVLHEQKNATNYKILQF